MLTSCVNYITAVKDERTENAKKDKGKAKMDA